LAAGEQLADVSRSVGHAHERVTKKHYAHVVKTTFSKSMRRALGVTPATPILTFPTSAASQQSLERPRRFTEHRFPPGAGDWRTF
jgi:hypothetical protein